MKTVWQLHAAEECIWDVSADWRGLLCSPFHRIPVAPVLCDGSVQTLVSTLMLASGELEQCVWDGGKKINSCIGNGFQKCSCTQPRWKRSRSEPQAFPARVENKAGIVWGFHFLFKGCSKTSLLFSPWHRSANCEILLDFLFTVASECLNLWDQITKTSRNPLVS